MIQQNNHRYQIYRKLYNIKGRASERERERERERLSLGVYRGMPLQTDVHEFFSNSVISILRITIQFVTSISRFFPVEKCLNRSSYYFSEHTKLTHN